jgi:hypothetical protein
MKTIYLIGGPSDLTKRVIPNDHFPTFWEEAYFSQGFQGFNPANMGEEILCRRILYRFWRATPKDEGIYLLKEDWK